MSYLVARMKKNKLANLSGMQIHNERKTENHSNKDIDVTRSHLNYSLVNRNKKMSYQNEFVDYINQEKISKRAIRKDAVLLNEWIISSDRVFFEGMDEFRQREFFETAVEFFQNRYGKENVRFAEVHLDETTPHMHLGIIPMNNGKLSSKTLFTREELRSVQQDLPDYINYRGYYGIERGKSNSERKNLTVPEYKAMKEELARDQQILFQEKEKVKQVEEFKKSREKFVYDNVENLVTPSSNGLGYYMTKENFDYMKNQMSNYHDSIEQFKDVEKKCNALEWENGKLKKELNKRTDIFNDFGKIIKNMSYFLSKYLNIKSVYIDAALEYARFSLKFKWNFLETKNKEAEKIAHDIHKKETSTQFVSGNSPNYPEKDRGMER